MYVLVIVDLLAVIEIGFIYWFKVLALTKHVFLKS